MRAGRLRHRIRLEAPVRIPDAIGGASVQWRLVAVLAADVVPEGQGSEQQVAGETALLRRFSVSIRHREGVTADMRVVYASRILQINSVVDVDERHDELQLACTELAGEVVR